MRKIYIQVSESTLYRLAEVAERERRDPRQQAAYILECALAKAAEKSVAQPSIDAGELTLA